MKSMDNTLDYDTLKGRFTGGALPFIILTLCRLYYYTASSEIVKLSNVMQNCWCGCDQINLFY